MGCNVTTCERVKGCMHTFADTLAVKIVCTIKKETINCEHTTNYKDQFLCKMQVNVSHIT